MRREIIHGSFTIERTLQAAPEKVFQAFADRDSKEKWFKGPEESAPAQHTMDFKVGGHESNSGQFHGVVHRFEAAYYDIVPDERIIYAYEMYLDDKRISVSLATIELQPEGDGTYLVLTENGAFLDGADTPEERERGTQELLNALEASLTN